MCIAVNSLEANADNTLTAYKLKTFITRLQCLNIVVNASLFYKQVEFLEP